MRLSASQISTYRDCPRKWAWRHIAGIEAPSNASAALGSEVHEQLEKYLLGGDLDFTKESGEIASVCLEFLPLPGTPGMLVEKDFEFEGPSGHTYLGYKDVSISGDVPRVIDHKTTSNLRWAKTPSDLLTDPQAVLYAVDEFRKHPHSSLVDLQWNYTLTKGARKCVPVRAAVTPEDVLPAFQAIETQAEEMAEVKATVKDPLELPPTTDHCAAYGGCPYQGNCNLSPFDRMRSIVSNAVQGSSLLDRIRAQRAAAGAQAINPPEASLPPTAEERATTDGGHAVPAPGEPHALGSLAPAPAAASVPAQVAAPVPLPAGETSPETPKRGPGRPKKDPVAPAPNTEPGIAAMQAAAGVLSTHAHASGKKIGTLFVNCAPVGLSYVDANVLILAGKAKLRAEGFADYRLAPFGEGPGRLALAVASEVDAQLGQLGYVVLDTQTPEGVAVCGELSDRAGTVVR